jgi:hypothetical protein
MTAQHFRLLPDPTHCRRSSLSTSNGRSPIRAVAQGPLMGSPSAIQTVEIGFVEWQVCVPDDACISSPPLP